MPLHHTTLFVNDLRLKVFLGHTDAERAYAQVVSVNITLFLKTQNASITDELDDTLNYVSVVKLLEQSAKNGSWKLLEKMCAEWGEQILALSPLLERVEIACKKFVLAQCESVGCKIVFAT